MKISTKPKDQWAAPLWAKFALCRGRSELFFGPEGEGTNARVAREHEAFSLCAACPAQLACRNYARAHHERGIWGGEDDRTRRRRPQRQSVGSPSTLTSTDSGS